MSYCVQCGVKLSDYHKKCPLCETLVINPNNSEIKPNTDYPDYHVVNPKEEKEVKHYVTGIILSLQVFVYSLIVFVLDWLMGKGITWSLIPIASLLLVWVGVAIPFLRKKNKFFTLFTYDSIAVMIYLLTINYIISQSFIWSRYAVVGIALLWIVIAGIFISDKIRKVFPITIFYIVCSVIISFIVLLFMEQKATIFQIGIPIMVTSLVLALISYFIIMSSPGGKLSLLIVLLVDISLLCFIIDLTLYYRLHEHFGLTWSIIVNIGTIPSIATMIAVKKSGELYAVISRRLHK